jgi:hypothetical protein
MRELRIIHRAERVIGVALVGTLLASASAQADTVSSMTAELQAAGVPNVSVTETTPAAATSADVAAFDQDPSGSYASITDQNLLSPDPTNPLPVVTVAFGQAQVTQWPGLLLAPDVAGYPAVEDSQMPIWRLDIMEAAKHAIIAGLPVIGGVGMQPQSPNQPDPATPDAYITPPDSSEYPTAALPQTMSLAAVQAAVGASLPTAFQQATVSVVDFAGGQRRVTVSASTLPEQAEVSPPSQLYTSVLNAQAQLNQQGANIGSVIVNLTDQTSSLPLVTFAGDASWGESFTWVAPPATPFVDTGPAPIPQGAGADVAAYQQHGQDLINGASQGQLPGQ